MHKNRVLTQAVLAMMVVATGGLANAQEQSGVENQPESAVANEQKSAGANQEQSAAEDLEQRCAEQRVSIEQRKQAVEKKKGKGLRRTETMPPELQEKAKKNLLAWYERALAPLDKQLSDLEAECNVPVAPDATVEP